MCIVSVTVSAGLHRHYLRQYKLMCVGKLRLSLSKEYYERAGLVGKPSRFGGRKRQRWRALYSSDSSWEFTDTIGLIVVEYDLRSDKMMHGKNALERIIWSFTEVLTGPVTFLFCDLYQRKLFQIPPLCFLMLTNIRQIILIDCTVPDFGEARLDRAGLNTPGTHLRAPGYPIIFASGGNGAFTRNSIQQRSMERVGTRYP